MGAFVLWGGEGVTGGLDRGWGEIWSWKGLRFGGGVYTLEPSRPEERGKKGPSAQ